jgi:hypothetical protein
MRPTTLAADASVAALSLGPAPAPNQPGIADGVIRTLPFCQPIAMMD